MEQNSNYKLYKIRHRSMMADLFEEHCCLLGKEVLDNVFVRDFLKMKEIPFIDKGKQYQRQHDWIFRGDVAKIQIGVEGKYGIVGASAYINYSELRYEPYVAIEDDTNVFKSIDVVADMVARSLNWVYKDSGITLYLEPWIIADGEAIHWLKDCCEAHDKAKLVDNFDANAKWDLKTVVNRLINKHKKKLGVSPPKMENTNKSFKTIRAAIVDQTKADVIMRKIENCMLGKTDPEDYMMPITAAIAVGKMNEFSLSVFRRSFPGLNISSTSFYRLRNPKCNAYHLNKAFDRLVEEFAII